MTVTRSEVTHGVEETLLQFLHEIDFAERLWMHTDHRHFTFWLLTAPVSHERERMLYQVNTLIYRTIPEADFDFLVINPAMYDEPFVFEPPHDVREIRLR